MSVCANKRRLLVIDDSEAIHLDFRRIISLEQPTPRGALEELEEALFGARPSRGGASAELTFELDSAFQGQEGVARVREALAAGCPYSLIFLDYRMPPGWNGAETLRRLRQVVPSRNAWESSSRRVPSCPAPVQAIPQAPATYVQHSRR